MKLRFVLTIVGISVLTANNCQSQLQRSRGPLEILSLFEKCGQIQEIPGDIRTRVPWTVAIYTRTRPGAPWKYFLMGALIGPSTVISVFGGPYGALPKGASGKYHYFKPSNVMVVGGLTTSNLNTTDEHAQYAEVQFLQPYNDRNPDNQIFHFFILNLKTSFNVSSPYVRPICLVIHRPNATPYVKWDGYASSFSTETLPVANSPDINRKLTVYKGTVQSKEACESAFQYYFGAKNGSHVFCAKSSGTVGDEDHADRCIAHGSPGAVFVARWWFLKGLGAFAPVRRKGLESCDRNTLYFLAHFINQPVTDWARNQMECSPNRFTCNNLNNACLDLHKVCDGIVDCSDGTDEDSVFCKASNSCPKSSPFMCHLNGPCITTSQVCDGVPDCPGGNDENSSLCSDITSAFRSNIFEMSQKCKAIPAHEGLQVICFKKGTNSETNCSEATSGDTAQLSCKKYFTSKSKSSSLSVTCDPAGSWKPAINFACAHECGKPSDERGRIFPWHAAIYYLYDDGNYKLICGGTLIESAVVVTAARCLTALTGLSADLKKYRVVLAPMNRTFEENEDNPETQIFQISRIWIHPKFSYQNSMADIAVARLDKHAKYNSRIRAACYLQPHLARIPDVGFNGEISEFKNTESTQRKWSLDEVEIVSGKSCISNGLIVAPESFCILRTQDFLLAGRIGTDDTNCTRVSIGNGVVFPLLGNHNVYVLKGIVSDGEVYQQNRAPEIGCGRYSTVVHLDSFKHWVFGVLENSYKKDF